MKIIQSSKFEKIVKKFSSMQKKELDKHIIKIMANPNLGLQKKGDLNGVFVYKFKLESNQYLLAYKFSTEKLELLMIGAHENYYRELKKYLKS